MEEDRYTAIIRLQEDSSFVQSMLRHQQSFHPAAHARFTVAYRLVSFLAIRDWWPSVLLPPARAVFQHGQGEILCGGNPVRNRPLTRTRYSVRRTGSKEDSPPLLGAHRDC